MKNSTPYNLEVLEDLQRGSIGMGRALRALRWGGLARKLPGLFILIRLRSEEGRGFTIPLFLPIFMLLSPLAAAIVQLVRLLAGKRPYPGLWAAAMLLWALPFLGREPLVDVQSADGAKVQIALW
jgi:hypothetical protein